MKTKTTLGTALAAVLAITIATPARAYIAGDGKGKPEYDCFIGLEGYSPDDQTPYDKKGKKLAIQCTDGEACDLDGAVNGSCQFSVAVSVNKAGVDGCTPAPLKKVVAKAKAKGVKLDFYTTAPAPLDGSSAVSAFLAFNVQHKKFGKAKPKLGKGKVSLKAVKPKDADKFTFICNPSGVTPTTTTSTTLPPQCANNTAGGPRQVTLVVNGDGADLDNGKSGQSHNFPVPQGTSLNYCLTNCDDTDPVCNAAGPTGDGTANGTTFGPPLPLFSAGVPVCVINEYTEPSIQGTANVETGEFIAELEDGTPTPIVLNSRIFQSSATLVCPRCNGGKCVGGRNAGKNCTISGTVVVNNPPGTLNDSYNLSNDCPPGGQGFAAVGSIEVVLDLTTGTSMKAADAAGSFPCPDQSEHDGCLGATCTIDCSPDGPSPTQDPKGGVSQWCCNNAERTPCFPTSPAAGSQAIIRTGEANVPTPAWSTDPSTYPKTGTGKLAATFCEGASESIAVNGVAGLPGPGALILPGDMTWFGNE